MVNAPSELITQPKIETLVAFFHKGASASNFWNAYFGSNMGATAS